MSKFLGHKKGKLGAYMCLCHHGPRDHMAVTARIFMLLCFCNSAIAWCFLCE